MECLICDTFIPNIKILMSPVKRGSGLVWKDICEPCYTKSQIMKRFKWYNRIDNDEV